MCIRDSSTATFMVRHLDWRYDGPGLRYPGVGKTAVGRPTSSVQEAWHVEHSVLAFHALVGISIEGSKLVGERRGRL